MTAPAPAALAEPFATMRIGTIALHADAAAAESPPDLGHAMHDRHDDREPFAALCRRVADGDSHAAASGRHWLRPDW